VPEEDVAPPRQLRMLFTPQLRRRVLGEGGGGDGGGGGGDGDGGGIGVSGADSRHAGGVDVSALNLTDTSAAGADGREDWVAAALRAARQLEWSVEALRERADPLDEPELVPQKLDLGQPPDDAAGAGADADADIDDASAGAGGDGDAAASAEGAGGDGRVVSDAATAPESALADADDDNAEDEADDDADGDARVVTDAATAEAILRGCSCLVGMHPDQAAEVRCILGSLL